MLLSKMLFIILLTILFQYARGTEKGNPFIDDEDYSGASGVPFRDNGVNTCKDDFSGNGINNDSSPDAYINYSNCSFHYELTTLTRWCN